MCKQVFVNMSAVQRNKRGLLDLQELVLRCHTDVQGNELEFSAKAADEPSL